MDGNIKTENIMNTEKNIQIPTLSPERKWNDPVMILPPMLPEGFIGKTEVARRLNKTVRTVDNWMKRRLLVHYKIGRSVCFKWSEVEAHLAATCRMAGRNLK